MALERCGGDRLADPEDVGAVAARAADDRGAVAAVVAQHGRGVDLQHARALLRDRGEHAVRAGLPGHERGHPAQRALLGGEPADLDELGLGIALQGPVVVAGVLRLPVGQIDSGRDQRGRLAVLAHHRAVRPCDQAPGPVLRPPVPDLWARRPGPPDVGQEVPERLALLVGDDELARVATEHLFAPEPGRALTRIVEQQDPGLTVVHTDERLRGLGQDRGEGFAENELLVVVHARPEETLPPPLRARNTSTPATSGSSPGCAAASAGAAVLGDGSSSGPPGVD